MTRKIFFSLFLIFSTNFIFSQDTKEVNFDKEFIKKYNGKAKVEINEVKELLHIMVAITKSGLANDDMVQQNGQYYKDVTNYFKPFQNEKIITKFDSILQSNLINYVFLTGNAITYDFDGNNKLKPSKYFILPANEVAKIKITENPITKYKSEIEDFAEKSNFRNFYNQHKDYYNSLISDYENNANVKKQWKWLEKNFRTKINSYQILCSPLINGLNYTGELKQNNFRLIQMVLPPLIRDPKWTEGYTIAFNTKGMFTETDHNYVNPPSNKYKNQIDVALSDREKWVNTKTYGTEYYPNPIKVFNEYMTFGVFILYAQDIFKNDPETFKNALNEVNDVMANQRGFRKMKEFNEELLSLRKKNKSKKIEDLYPELLEWCKTQ